MIKCKFFAFAYADTEGVSENTRGKVFCFSNNRKESLCSYL